MTSEDLKITLTDGLVKKIRRLQAGQNQPSLMLRVAVLGGGCSGFQYEFSFTTAPEAGDLTFEKDGVCVVVDDVSLEFLKNCTVDYVDDLIGSGFQVKNPNATSSCGCGTSFSA
ncbi:MAG TPA: iron-sulfur cluster insertion protein ErpA [Micavibrio sp.]|jgi:iron-sulfur cluster insertion protein